MVFGGGIRMGIPMCQYANETATRWVIGGGYWIWIVAYRWAFMVHRVPSLRSGGQNSVFGFLDLGM